MTFWNSEILLLIYITYILILYIYIHIHVHKHILCIYIYIYTSSEKKVIEGEISGWSTGFWSVYVREFTKF